jgi:hypothetical protein
MESHLVESCSIFEVFLQNAKFPTFCGVSLMGLCIDINGWTWFPRLHQGREFIANGALENGAFCTVFSENFHKF